MKTSLRLLVALLLVTAAVPFIAWCHTSAQSQSNGQAEKFHRAGKPVRDQYIVVLKPDTPGEEVEAVTNELLQNMEVQPGTSISTQSKDSRFKCRKRPQWR